MNKKGFTIIEILIFIAIIALLVVLAAVALNSARESYRDAKRLTDVRSVHSALELYYNEFGSYPIQEADIGTTSSNCLSEDGFEASSACVGDSIFLNFVPAETGKKGSTYHYYGEQNDYCISFMLEKSNSTIDLDAGPNKMTSIGFESGSCQ